MAKDIHNAAGFGNLQAVKEFASAGISPNIRGNNGITPLIMSARFHHNHIIEWLLENGADVDLPDNQGRTALMHAAQSRNIAGMEILISNGAELQKQDNDGETALSLAKWEEISDVIDFLEAQ